MPASEVTPDQRRVAKVLNFGIAYGLSAFGLSQRLDMPPAEAQAIIDRYFARYAGVKRWLDGTVAAARESGEVRTLWGRRRELPDIRSRNPGLRQAAERMAVNTPIQGTAADIVKVAMLRVDRALSRGGAGVEGDPAGPRRAGAGGAGRGGGACGGAGEEGDGGGGGAAGAARCRGGDGGELGGGALTGEGGTG